MSAPKGGQLVCGEALKAVVACTKSALTLRPLPFPFLPVCVASSCASPEVQARALFFAQRRSAALQGASWWSKKVFEGVPAELRQLLDALLRGADHGSGHTGQRHGCRRDRVVAYGQRQCVHRVCSRNVHVTACVHVCDLYMYYSTSPCPCTNMYYVGRCVLGRYYVVIRSRVYSSI